MKKLLLMGAALLWQFTVTAQDFRFGLKGGVNFADIAGKDLHDEDHDYRLSWHAGVAVNIRHRESQVFSVQPELIYSRKGYQNTGKPVEVRNAVNNLVYTEQEGGPVALHYLDLPVMLNFRKGIVVFEIGPQLSYLVAMENEATVTRTFSDGSVLVLPSPRRFDKEQVHKTDIGIGTGLRLETPNGIGFGLRFNQGFIKLSNSENPAANRAPAPEGRNQCFQLFASYLIPK